MKVPWSKKSKEGVRAIATMLSVAFIALIVGPVFLYATDYHPVTFENGVPNGGGAYDSDPYSSIDDETTYPNGIPTGGGVDQPTDYTPIGAAPAPGDPNFVGPTQNEKLKAPANQPETPPANKADLDCGFGWVTAGGSLNGCVAWVMEKTMWLSARTLWMAGVLFNITLDYTLNLNNLLVNLPVVDIGWKVLRDLANIVFIFIALWAGISITLGIGDDGKKAWGLLAEMVLVALFINFSLFIAKAVVDVSNVASLHFYSLIVEPGHEKDYDKGLSEAFMYGLKLSTLYNSKALSSGAVANNNYINSAGAGAKGGLSFTNIILIGFFGSLFIIVTAWVFFAAAIMFIYRAITLIFLMMLSPLAFVGLILPGASGMAHEWWHKLWSQAFFAPLYLALAYIVVKTINTPAFSGALVNSSTGSGFAAAITGDGAGTIAVVFNFIILIGLMVACLVVAQSLGAKGSDMAMAGFEKIKQVAVGETSGFVGRSMMRSFGLGSMGEKWQERNAAKAAKGERVGLFSKIGASALKYTSVRNLNERLGQTKLGNTGVGKFFREQTTGRLAAAKFGGSKSAEESYEESEHNASVRRAIGLVSRATSGVGALQSLRQNQHLVQARRFAAEGNLEGARRSLELAQQPPPLTPQQQQQVATAQAALTAAQNQPPSPQQQQQIANAQHDLTQAEQDLIQAQAISPQQQAQITLAQQNLAQEEQTLAQNPADTIQQSIVVNMRQRLTQAQAISPQQQATIATRQAAVTTAQQDLAQAQSVPQQQQQAAVAAAQAALTVAQTPPPLTPQQQTAITTAQQELTRMQTELETANTAVSDYETQHGAEMARLVKTISEAFAKLSAKEVVELIPKEEFFTPELVDMEVFGPDKAAALMASEHLSEEDKDHIMHARLHRILDDADRGEQRIKWNNEAWVRYTKEMQRFQKEIKQIENGIATSIQNPSKPAGQNYNIDELRSALQSKEQELNTENAKQKPTQATQVRLKTELDALKTALAPAEQQLETAKTAAKTAGTLTEPAEEMPDQPGWDNDALRKAIRELRGTKELSSWYRHTPDVFNRRQLMATVMQNNVDAMRDSQEFDQPFILKARTDKRFYVQNSGDLTLGIPPNLLRELHADDPYAVDLFRKDANNQLKKLGKNRYFEQFNVDVDGDPKKNMQKRLADLLTRYNDKHPNNTVEDAVSIEERVLRHDAGLEMYNQVSQNLANDETAKMPSVERDLYAVYQKMDKAQITPMQKKDIDEKVRPVEFLLDEMEREIMGISKMSTENLNIFTAFVNQGLGDFIPWENLEARHKKTFEYVKGMIGRKDARSLPSIFGRMKDDPERFLELLNKERREGRAKMGLPTLPDLKLHEVPTNRIGAFA